MIDVNIGIELGSEHAGLSTDFITVRNNIVSNVDFAGIALGGYSSSASGEGGGNARNNTIVNNTVYTPAQGLGLCGPVSRAEQHVLEQHLRRPQRRAARARQQRHILPATPRPITYR